MPGSTPLPFMEEGMARWPFGPPNAGVALDFAGAPPTPGELRRLVDARWADLPRLAQRLVGDARGARRHRWEAVDDGPDPAGRVRCADVTLREAVSGWFHTPFPDGPPPWNLHLLRGAADGDFTLLFRMHHSLLDGRSLTTLLRALLDGAPPVDGPASVAEPRALRRTAAGGPGMLTVGLPVPMPGKGERKPAYTVVRLPADLLRAAREAVTGRRATTNEVFMAVVSGVLRSCLATADRGEPEGAARQVWLSVPVDQRPAGHGDFLGNAFTNVRVAAPVTLADPVARLAACTGLLTTVTRPRGVAERLVEGAFGAFPGTVQALARGRVFAAAYAPAACTYVHLRETGRTLAGRRLRQVTAVPMIPPDDTVTFGLGGCAQGYTLSVATNSGAEDAELLAEAFVHELGLLGRVTAR
ncbi:wax ester/triacylglycerol synthase domain-containing protein [Streptomyces sp. NPDC096132]|uniref:wax ester/triacylglycerol synthase domain-containing protein n=1 Tax=Streptomyces sp. NPDC096132 TaxID=3366075 RepID=UPI0038298F99